MEPRWPSCSSSADSFPVFLFLSLHLQSHSPARTTLVVQERRRRRGPRGASVFSPAGRCRGFFSQVSSEPSSASNPRVLLLGVRTRGKKNEEWQPRGCGAPGRPATLWAALPRAPCPGQSLLDSESAGTLGCHRLNGPCRSEEPVFYSRSFIEGFLRV